MCIRDRIQRVLLFVRIAQVAAVAQRSLAELARLEHGIDGDAHVLDPVERVEDPEDIDAADGGPRHEETHDVVRIIGVADGVRRAQQHLQQEIRHLRAQRRQAQPGILAPVSYTHLDVYKRQVMLGARCRISDKNLFVVGSGVPKDFRDVPRPIACLLYTSAI